MKTYSEILLLTGALAVLGFGHAIAQVANPELLAQAKKEGRARSKKRVPGREDAPPDAA